MAGRPKAEVDLDELKNQLDAGYTKTEVARNLGISRPTLYKLMIDYGLNTAQQLGSSMTDAQIDVMVLEAKELLPNMGERLLIGYFNSKGLKLPRDVIRAAIRRVDPDGLRERRNQMGRRINRRVYTNPHPHFLWHIDTNHKLIRWKLVVHAAIDGFSRSIIYLSCQNNNRPDTTLTLFTTAVQDIGQCPSKIRTDLGTENTYIREMMGSDSMVGSSVHNQRVERLNRDINNNIRERYGVIFYSLENQGILDTSSLLDIAVLHYVFLPRINNSLDMLKTTFNHHPIRTENNLTPTQLVSRYSHLHRNRVLPRIPAVQYPQSEMDFLTTNVGDVLRNAGVNPLNDDGDEGRRLYRDARQQLLQNL